MLLPLKMLEYLISSRLDFLMIGVVSILYSLVVRDIDILLAGIILIVISWILYGIHKYLEDLFTDKD